MGHPQMAIATVATEESEVYNASSLPLPYGNVVPTQRVIDDATPLMLIEDAASIPRLGATYNLYVMMSTAHRTMDTIEAAIAICTVGA